MSIRKTIKTEYRLCIPLHFISVAMLLLTLLCSRSSFAFVEVAGDKERVPLGASFEILEDKSNALSLERILQENATQPWVQSTTDLPSFGLSESSFWFRTAIRNSETEARQQLIEIANPNLNRIELHYRVKGSAQFKNILLGTDFPYSRRIIANPNFLIPVEVPANSILEVYIRLQTTSVTMLLDASIWDPVYFNEKNRDDTLLQGMYYGIVGVMVLYNFFIFLVSREKSYLYYCAFGLLAGLMVASYNGYTFAYLWPDAVEWQHYCTVMCGSMATVFACLFVRQFLQMQRHFRTLDGIIKYLAIISFVETISIPLLSFKFVCFLLGITTVPIYLLFMYAGLKVWRRGDQVALYFTLPWIIVGVAAITLVFSAYNVISSSLFNKYGIATASTIELVFLALALAKRINQVRESAVSTNEQLREQQIQARITQEKILQLERKAKEELEMKVLERTRELNRALNQLSDTHARLQLMSTQDSLTGLKNRRYFDSALQNEWARAIRNNGLLSLLVLDVDYFKNINDSFGHQTGDEVLIEIAAIFSQQLQHSADVVARFGGEEFIILLPQCNLHAAVALAERLRLSVQQLEVRTDNGVCKPTISIGVASVQPTMKDNPSKFVADADTALYEAKKSGRNRVCIANALPPLGEAKTSA